METIDITPTWAAVMPILLAALEDGTDEGKRIARAELTRLAGVVDGMNAHAKGTQPLEVKPDGEANFYSLLNGKNWIARVQLNGEFTTRYQETIMQSFAASFPQLPE
jgi:hypothetical protein